MILPRYRSTVAVFDGRIYASGLTNGSSKEFEAYDPKCNRWTQLASMNKFRFNFALIGSNGFLYAIGRQMMAEKYVPLENRWKKVCESGREHEANVEPTMDKINLIEILLCLGWSVSCKDQCWIEFRRTAFCNHQQRRTRTY